MKQLVTQAIILARTDYGEADRILTVVTPTYGKLRLLAKGVRRVKSKLAGGIELFSVSEITFIKGRSEIGTLISTRLITHYGHIVEDLDRTMTGYELIKQFNKMTEDEPEAAYFDLLHHVFAALNDATVSLPLIRLWFCAHSLKLAGHTPNLQADSTGAVLDSQGLYDFDFDSMAFMPVPEERARFWAGHIKLFRLVFAEYTPKAIAQVQGIEPFVPATLSLTETIRRQVA
jgi:DNA repair protein RecO (recombination protein O)